MSVVVFVDNIGGKPAKTGLEATCYAKKIADATGGSVTAVSYGNLDASELGNYGASKVMVANNVTSNDSQQLAKVVSQAANDTGANVVVLSHDVTGKAIAGRVAVRLEAGLVTGAVEVPSGNSIKKAVFSGKAFAHYSISTEKKVISVLPNSIPVEATGGSAEVVDFAPDAGEAKVTVKETKGAGGAIPLPEAKLVVSGGRGLKGPENWGIIEDLAEALGAVTACSRPVSDIGWRPHHEHVGQTGLAIRPNLYIAIGISGAIQHLAGVNGSKTIVVINTDAEAPFFKAADYGIVGDAFDVVPKLTAAVKEFKGAN